MVACCVLHEVDVLTNDMDCLKPLWQAAERAKQCLLRGFGRRDAQSAACTLECMQALVVPNPVPFCCRCLAGTAHRHPVQPSPATQPAAGYSANKRQHCAGSGSSRTPTGSHFEPTAGSCTVRGRCTAQVLHQQHLNDDLLCTHRLVLAAWSHILIPLRAWLLV